MLGIDFNNIELMWVKCLNAIHTDGRSRATTNYIHQQIYFLVYNNL